MASIRAFIAVELSAEVKAVLHEVASTLEKEVAPGVVKWVQPERMHLTFRFLGDTPLEKLDDLSAALDRVALAHEPFSLTLDSLGCFPNERRPRVIWVGVQGDVTDAIRLRGSLDEALQELGWDREDRAFQPHLTLGRVKDPRAKVRLPWGRRVAAATSAVREVVLFESKLRADGPLYIARHVSRLAVKS